MAKIAPRQKTPDISNFIPSILIIAFLIVGFIPNWSAVDKIAPQWLYLSFLNFICGLFLFIKRDFYKTRTFSVVGSWMSLTYIFFVTWAGISYFYAINPTEVLVNIVRHFNTLFMFLNLGIFIYGIKDKNRLLSIAIMSILSIEVYSVLEQALEMYNSRGLVDSGNLKGVTANRNITAFSIAIKIPFVLYLIFTVNKIWLRLLLSFLVLMSLFSLSMIESRASYIASGLIGVIIFLWTSIRFFQSKSLNEFIPNLFYIIPLVLALSLNQLFFSGKAGGDAVSRAATISISQSDSSIDKRLRYYEDVATHFFSNPIFGVGIGNWKLSSIFYDREDIDGYIVPYHAHSDFIQLGAELGIFGFLSYLGIFLIAGFFILFILFKSDLVNHDKWFVLCLAAALGVYFIDANLNFPIARPQMLATWALIMALISFYYHKGRGEKTMFSNKLSIFFPIVLLILIIPSIYITNTTYKSLKGQMFLLRDFNSNNYSIKMDQIDNITPDIPNITVTTIPMKSIKARYYYNAKKYDKALDLLDQGIPANPYLFFSENMKAQIYLDKGNLDSAFVNARKAFYGLPKNALHASIYVQTLQRINKPDEIKKAFKVLSKKSGPGIWKNFLFVLTQKTNPNDEDLKKYSIIAHDFFPDDKDIFSFKRRSIIGEKNINLAQSISSKGLDFFNKKLYTEAAIEFENASKIDSLEYAHFENAASAYFMGGDYGKALIYSERVMNQFNPKTGKSEYICALTNINIGGKERACELLLKSINLGYSAAQATYDQQCN